jgi:hypothetical protein
MDWHLTNRANPSARAIADRHYNRQKVGAEQFVPPGRCVVLVIPDVAFWITSWPFAEYVKHAWAGAWVCSAFRNERRDLHLSSSLIVSALACTRWLWNPPAQGMITFVDPDKTTHKRDPGRCFRKAGFHVSGTMPCCADKPGATDGGLVALHMADVQIPDPQQPLGATARLFA